MSNEFQILEYRYDKVEELPVLKNWISKLLYKIGWIKKTGMYNYNAWIQLPPCYHLSPSQFINIGGDVWRVMRNVGHGYTNIVNVRPMAEEHLCGKGYVIMSPYGEAKLTGGTRIVNVPKLPPDENPTIDEVFKTNL